MPSSQSRTRWPLSNDDGYATVATAGFISAIVALAGVVAWHAGNVIAQAQAQLAADQAAVAGAQERALGAETEAACAMAALVAELNAGTLEACTQHGDDIIVEVKVKKQSAHARAGPL